MAAPWRDALKRGGAKLPAETAVAPAAGTAPPSAIDPAAVSPKLAALIREREALQSSIAALQGAAASAGPDPRFPVTSMRERRAEIDRWLQGREARRAERPTPSQPQQTAVDRRQARPARPSTAEQVRSIAGRMLGGLDAAREAAPVPPPLRATPGETPASALARPVRERPGEPMPALRPTPGESAGGGAPPQLRATPGENVRSRRLLDAVQSFETARDAARAFAERAEAPVERPRRRTKQDSADSGMLDRAFDRWESLRDKPRQAEKMLDRARRAIPDEWAERARRAVPALGKGDDYDRRMKKLLEVAVGTVDQVSEQSDRMRSLARDVRELRAADEANDEARRDRAIERLRAKREDGG
ncbi:hypothetical protein E2493_11940 [Sphingomonas parva]|uniref:Uncharacterized protein n=1 Tax=Sphingomonas parva TaxID=2555898 RepID=A0A4Y8ZUH3_9SPHN|nr:hypothetical protein [Sphingomonas parva]TFI58106.1 hypothetical protein E2493_11940 [Sphingomonas parva]